MDLGVAGTLRREFIGRADAAAYRRFQQHQLQERERRERKEERAEAENDVGDLLDMAALIVTEAELREFRLEIDRYDAAAVEALYRNQIELDRAREELERILAKAHVLPDGRRVFKTEDGLRVFDESGQELPPEVIDPAEIADERPRWEVAEDALDRVDQIMREREELLAYQAKLDEARERLDVGDMSREEFDHLRKEIVGDMPEAVRAQFPELANEQQEPSPPSPTASQEIVLDLDDDLIPTATGPKASALGLGS